MFIDEEEEEEHVAVTEPAVKLEVPFLSQVKSLLKHDFRNLFGYEVYNRIGHFLDESLSLIISGFGHWMDYPRDTHLLKGNGIWCVCLCVSKDGRYCYSGRADGFILCWDLLTMITDHYHPQKWLAHEHCVRCVDVRPGLLVSGSDYGIIRVWNVHTYRLIRKFKIYHDSSESKRKSSMVHSVKFVNDDGSQLISASDDSDLRLFSLINGDCLRVFKGHTEGVRCMISVKDSSLVITGSLDQSVRVWDLNADDKSERCIWIIKEGIIDGYVQSVCLNCDRSLLFCITHLKAILLRWPTLEMIDISEEDFISEGVDIQNAEMICFHPSDPNVLAFSDRTRTSLMLLDLSKHNLVVREMDIEGAFSDALFTPDGSRVLVCLLDGRILVWNTTDD